MHRRIEECVRIRNTWNWKKSQDEIGFADNVAREEARDTVRSRHSSLYKGDFVGKGSSDKDEFLWSNDLNPMQFFHEKIVEAQEKNHSKLTENVEFYLVNLLCDYVRSHPESKEESCLALLLKKALESSPLERVPIYKKIADNSLYFSGFFQEYFNNKSFNVRYYVSMGESAYGELASLMKGASSYQATMAQIYKEMSKSFLQAVDILLHIAENTHAQDQMRSNLSLYDAWLSTSSPKIQKELFRRGIHPVAGSHKKIQ